MQRITVAEQRAKVRMLQAEAAGDLQQCCQANSYLSRRRAPELTPERPGDAQVL